MIQIGNYINSMCINKVINIEHKATLNCFVMQTTYLKWSMITCVCCMSLFMEIVHCTCLEDGTVLCPSPLKILRSRVFHLYSSLILIGLLGNFWLKTVFVLEWPILKCLHTIKECQVPYAKTYLNMQCNGKFWCALRNITSNVSVVKYWASWSFPDKNLPSRKEIISNCQWGYYCIGLWWILFDPKRNA